MSREEIPCTKMWTGTGVLTDRMVLQSIWILEGGSEHVPRVRIFNPLELRFFDLFC